MEYRSNVCNLLLGETDGVCKLTEIIALFSELYMVSCDMVSVEIRQVSVFCEIM